MDEIFGPDGIIAQHHPNYEYRPGQVEMADAVHDTLQSGGVALIEAGTGTGKTLAYLIPAIAAEGRVIVSTATKNLQEQLINKDVPFLQKILPREFTAVNMKGRANYICLHRLKQAEETPILTGLDEMDQFDEIRRWAAETQTGDRAELIDLPEDLHFWPQIDARGETCLGQKCPDFDDCFITKMRQRALEADVVVVNHHLFFADLAMRGGDYGTVLPDYSTVIFDEAHELEDVAATYFGVNASNYRVLDLIQDTNKLAITDPGKSSDISRALARVSTASERFWLTLARQEAVKPGADSGSLYTDSSSSDLESSYSGTGGDQFRNAGMVGIPEGRYVLDSSIFVRRGRGGFEPTIAGEAYMSLVSSLTRLGAELGSVRDPAPEVENIIRRVEGMKFDLEFIVLGDDPTYVYWMEKRGRGYFLYATPIDVSGILSDRLFDTAHSAVLTSATLTAGEGFDFIKSRLGISRSLELVIEPQFDYHSQTVLYLPLRMPDPRTNQFLQASVEEIIRILEASHGRAFVLFTSAAAMREAYEQVRDRIDYPVFLQGQGSKAGLLEKFRNTEGAVLFATSSFWQGVDVQGEALSCVIIHKLPFAVPTDPVVAARTRFIEANGGNSFYDYSVPGAVITLKQGLGRLIRSTTDRGLLSVLDPRLRTKAYGRVFLQSLPPCKVTDKLEDAAKIFD